MVLQEKQFGKKCSQYYLPNYLFFGNELYLKVSSPYQDNIEFAKSLLSCGNSTTL